MKNEWQIPFTPVPKVKQKRSRKPMSRKEHDKAAKKKRRSVWTVNGGLPSLGKRRR